MKMPEKNLSKLDQYLRGAIGVATVSLGLFGDEIIGEPIVQGILILFGLANLVSLATGWCMVYQMVGISSNK